MCFYLKVNMIHILRDCPRVCSVWEKVNKSNWPLNLDVQSRLKENMENTELWYGSIPGNALFAFTVWALWK